MTNGFASVGENGPLGLLWRPRCDRGVWSLHTSYRQMNHGLSGRSSDMPAANRSLSTRMRGRSSDESHAYCCLVVPSKADSQTLSHPRPLRYVAWQVRSCLTWLDLKKNSPSRSIGSIEHNTIEVNWQLLEEPIWRTERTHSEKRPRKQADRPQS